MPKPLEVVEDEPYKGYDHKNDKRYRQKQHESSVDVKLIGIFGLGYRNIYSTVVFKKIE